MSENVNQLPSELKQAIIDSLSELEPVEVFSNYGTVSDELFTDVLATIAKDYDASNDQTQSFDKCMMDDFYIHGISEQLDPEVFIQFERDLEIFDNNSITVDVDDDSHEIEYLPTTELAFIVEVTIDNGNKLVTSMLTYGEWGRMIGGGVNSSPVYVIDDEPTEDDDVASIMFENCGIEDNETNRDAVESAVNKIEIAANSLIKTDKVTREFE